MAKQTFTVGQVLTAAQMTSLQQTAMGGGSATAKTASYTLVAADAGTTIIMNSGSATTVTVNTALFAAGDTVFIVNQGAGVCTVTAGTATVSTAGSLALGQYETGQLYFLSTSAAIFSEYFQATGGGGGKLLQLVQGTFATDTSTSSITFADTGLTQAITPTVNTSKVLVTITIPYYSYASSVTSVGGKFKVLRGATELGNYSAANTVFMAAPSGSLEIDGTWAITFLDSPATTSATTYKVQFASKTAGTTLGVSPSATTSTLTLMEIGA